MPSVLLRLAWAGESLLGVFTVKPKEVPHSISPKSSQKQNTPATRAGTSHGGGQVKSTWLSPQDEGALFLPAKMILTIKPQALDLLSLMVSLQRHKMILLELSTFQNSLCFSSAYL